ncbi:hypothetical protein KFL_007890010 [Klebsormidium nitens]|uniref:Uncharacterized protein n=1 Tax=Klebsormidium nitens TaxID=105231 RepID=A0A1Y1IKY8_KLENI|nr:hypothetical protein KFL_007890010 [Klebsormidium nitens]|eukprot:GAQ91454.1 hypothetical protein KFL_007890010 [Klebsormidium nitens]
MEGQLLLAEALVRELKEENAALILQSDKQITSVTAEAIVWVSNAQQEIKVLQGELKRLSVERDVAIAARDRGTCKYCIDMTQCSVKHNVHLELVKVLAPELGKLTGLTFLDLRCTGIGEAGAAALAPELGKLAGLTSLNMVYNGSGAAGAAALAPELGKLAGLHGMDLLLEQQNLRCNILRVLRERHI